MAEFDERSAGGRPAWLVGFVVVVAAAAFSGFRLPSLWSVTLYNVQVWDGTVRRSLVGTLLEPVWRAGGHAYWVYAAVAFLVLAALIAAAIAAAMRAKWTSQRIVVALWFLAPTGAYLFHEVGYLDQVSYLLLFMSLWLWSRAPAPVAVLPVALSPFVHELALVTTVPILAWFVLRGPASRAQRLALLIPLGAGLAVLLAPSLGDGQVLGLTARLGRTLGFPVREDAVALLAQSALGSWRWHTIYVGAVKGLPFAVVLALSWLLDWRLAGGGRAAGLRAATASLVATAAPLLALFGGWDADRWVFLCLGNFAVVLFLSLEREESALSAPALAAVVLPFALLFYSPLEYFDGYAFRTISSSGVHRLKTAPDFFRLPADRPPAR